MLRWYQWGELAGIGLLIGSTALQVFYLEPMKREIEWRLAAFSIQQTAQVQTSALFATRLALLETMNAQPAAIETAKRERDETLGRFKSSDADISDFVTEKTSLEDMLQLLAIGAFTLGTVLVGLGRAMEMKGR